VRSAAEPGGWRAAGSHLLRTSFELAGGFELADLERGGCVAEENPGGGEVVGGELEG